MVGSMCYHFVCIVDDGLYDGTLEVDVPYFVHVVENGRLLVENQGQNLDDQKMYLWQLSEKMDQKFYEKLRKIDIPPPMKIVENGTFFINHGLYDGTLEIGVPNFYDIVENDRKSRICRQNMERKFCNDMSPLHLNAAVLAFE
ncbi:hypothetical protein PFLG_02619 [Plasmodium falciparum RAJ116]|uniref:Uncharacterized protein n=1 Tax=Plasmodium falciparum RAJ116 TaxID=580058 RepID=A0A0L0CZR1_PLAFA|nr:hypothetical protein PFLG_02619 [Plasmodium falciparum RAJ116]